MALARLLLRGKAARLAPLLLLLGALLLRSQLLRAHALLLRAEPPPNAELAHPPSEIAFWFSEPLEAAFSGARIMRADGTEIPTGPPRIDPADSTKMILPLDTIEPGIYTVVWRTLSSVDGHEWVGSFPITILNADGTRPAGAAAVVAGRSADSPPSPGDVVLRWLSLLGAALLIGSLSMRWLLPRPLFPPPPRCEEGPERGGAARDSAAADIPDPVADRLLAACAIAGVLGLTLCGWLQLFVQALRLGGLDEISNLLFSTRPGKLLLMRQILLAGVVPLLGRGGYAGAVAAVHRLRSFAFGRHGQRHRPRVGPLPEAEDLHHRPTGAASKWSDIPPGGACRRRGPFPQRIGATLLALAALFTFSASSHAAAVPGSGWAVAADFAHLIAASVWAGGLIFLALLLVQMRRSKTMPAQADLARVLQRYSLSAQAAVFVLAATGLFSSFVQLPSVRSLFESTYGRFLIFKLALVAAAMCLGFLNNLAVRRAGETVSHGAALGRFSRRVLFEAGLAVVLFVSVALLVQTPTPATAQDRGGSASGASSIPFSELTYGDDLAIHLQVSPNRVGHNRYRVHLARPGNADIGDVQLVRLFFEHASGETGQARLDLAALGEDAYAGEGAFLNRAGDWSLSVYVRRRGVDDALAEIALSVPSPEEAQGSRRSAWRNPVARLPAGVLAGAFLAALSLIPLLWRRPLLRASRPLYVILAVGAVLFFLSGALLSFAALSP